MIACCFVKASSEGASEVKEMLAMYSNAFGQTINIDKSSIFFSRGCPKLLREGIKIALEVQKRI
jgi:hypothetical protein